MVISTNSEFKDETTNYEKPCGNAGFFSFLRAWKIKLILRLKINPGSGSAFCQVELEESVIIPNNEKLLSSHQISSS